MLCCSPTLGVCRGFTPDVAMALMRKFNTLIGAFIVHLGDVDGKICGLVSSFD